jgi:hypothetical protein
MFFDGFRYAIEMAALSYQRLEAGLIGLTDIPDGVDMTPIFIAAFQDAWAFVDSINRLRRLLDHMPRMPKKSPRLQVFSRATSDIETLRNAIQHLDEELAQHKGLAQPVWGTLSWGVVVDPKENRVRVLTIIAGTLGDGTHRMLNPLDYPGFYSVIDHITLSAADVSVDLSDVQRSLTKLAGSLQASVTDALASIFQEHPDQLGADLRVALDLELRAGTDGDTESESQSETHDQER